MKILIIGSTGMLGSTLKNYFSSINFDVKTLDRKQLDLSSCSSSELETKVLESNCDLVINCAGLIKQRKDIKISDFISINSLLPHRLADICQKHKIKMIHFTTDCVFDGIEGDYLETDMHTAKDDYGITKSLGEPNNCTVIRTSIIGEEEKNKLSLLEWVKSNKNSIVKGYDNHMWNGVTCLQAGKIILHMINNNNFWLGSRHIYSNSVSKFDLISMINEIYDLNMYIEKVNDDISINRTLSSVYDINGYKIPNLYKQILELKEFNDTIRNSQIEKYYNGLI